MRLRATLAYSCVLSLILGLALPVLAGALPPCVKAASSKNADFLVIGNVQVEPVQTTEGIARRIQQFSFEVFPKEKFINPTSRLTASATYWADWAQWDVVLDARINANQIFTAFCPLPLVTDDGGFLVLLAAVPAMSADWGVLRIYRRDSMNHIPGHGRLIREIPLKEIWLKDIWSPLRLPWQLATPEEGATDETRQWYAGATFSFSSDRQQLLIQKTEWGNTVRITLADGSVSNK